MKYIKKGDVQKMLSSNVTKKAALLMTLSHRKVDNKKQSREMGKSLLDSDLDIKVIKRYLKMLFAYESKLPVGLELECE